VSAVLDMLPQRSVVRRRHEEDDLQRSIVAYLRLALPPDGMVFAIPNGGLRSEKVAARLKGTGTLAGMPDLCVIYRSRAYFIELKTRTGVVSAAQRATMRKLIYCGADVMLCRSVDDVERSVRECGVPLRASVAA
jgi:hypothetical protein